MSDKDDLVINYLTIGHQKVVEEVHVLLIYDVLDTIVYLFEKLWKKVKLSDSWNEVLVTNHGLERVDRLQSNSLILADKIDSCVKEEHSIFECIWLILVHDVNQVSQE